jgi:hypothetical protein
LSTQNGKGKNLNFEKKKVFMKCNITLIVGRIEISGETEFKGTV